MEVGYPRAIVQEFFSSLTGFRGIVVLLFKDEFSKLLDAGGSPFGGMKFSPFAGRFK